MALIGTDGELYTYKAFQTEEQFIENFKNGPGFLDHEPKSEKERKQAMRSYAIYAYLEKAAKLLDAIIGPRVEKKEETKDTGGSSDG